MINTSEKFLDIVSCFSFAVFRITILAKEELHLPHYKGSALRGVFGHALKAVVCPFKKGRMCEECSLNEKCIYASIFEIYHNDSFLKSYGINTPPRPYIIRPPLENKQYYKRGEELVFHMVLIGEKTVMKLPYFIYAFIETGERGIGKNRGRFVIKKVESIEQDSVKKNVFSDNTLNSNFNLFSGSNFISKVSNLSHCSLNFLTPLQIRKKRKYIRHISFGIFFYYLLQRIAVLSHLYCEADCSVLSKNDFSEFYMLANKVNTHKSSLYWQEIKRYSSRQRQHTPLSGIAGKITFNGDINPFWPFIMLGSHIHIGRETTFGLGNYDIIT